MPTKWSKAKRLVKLCKAKLKYNNDGIRFLVLLFKPSGFETQDINLALDPGSYFDGYSVVSKRSHNENVEFYHPKEFTKYSKKKQKETGKYGKTKNLITERIENKKNNKKSRNGRKWHRKIRFDSRTGSKLSPTIQNMVNSRKFIISEFLKLYPISKIIIEDVAYNHWGDTEGKGRGFSQVEIGKTELYDYVKSLGIKLRTYRGYITKKVRVKLFGKDLKDSNKGAQNFYAHCLDSFSLATIGLDYSSYVNLQVRHIKRNWFTRRQLTNNKARRPKQGIERSKYFRYKKGGIVEYFTKLGKSNICRVKPTGIHSNHPKNWEYKDNGKSEKVKHYKNPQNYGGTIVKGQSKSKLPRGLSKKVIFNFETSKILGYRNRTYSLTYV
jgi:hypothetical protein